jgi:hypothetical protein
MDGASTREKEIEMGLRFGVADGGGDGTASTVAVRREKRKNVDM